MLRRLHREQVGECREFLVRESLGESVEESDVVAGRSAFIFFDSLAFRACAMGEVAVVLAYRDHLEVRICLEDGVQFLHNCVEHGRIGQTPLAVMAWTALPVDERIVFRMGLAVFVRRQDSVECMYPHVVDEFFARTFISVPKFEYRVLKAVTL